MKTKNQLPTFDAMLKFIESNEILVEVAIQTILAERSSINNLSADAMDIYCKQAEMLWGIVHSALRKHFQIPECEEFDDHFQLFLSHSIISVTRNSKYHNPETWTCCFMAALPHAFDGPVKNYVSAAYDEFRLMRTGNQKFENFLKHHIDALITHTPAECTPELFHLYKTLNY